MKHIKLYESFINELKSSKGESKEDVFKVLWNNGDIIINPTDIEFMSMSGGMNSISFRVSIKDKTVGVFLMDDWSDFKLIKRFQQGLLDMIKANIITSDWLFVVSEDEEATILNLGSTKVSEILKFNSDFTQIIPFAFHGTTSYHIDKIKKKGLIPRKKTGEDPNWEEGYTEKSDKQIYLTIDYRRAEYYANCAVNYLKKKGIDAEPVVLTIKNLPTKNIFTDDDFTTNMGALQLLQLLNTGKKAKPSSYIQGIRNSSQFALKGTIKPNQISNITVIKKEEETE